MPPKHVSQKSRWLKNGTAFNFPADGRISRVDKAEKLALVFKTCELDDAGIVTVICILRTVMMMVTAGTWSCEIMEFVKNGEQDQTNCWLDVEGEVDVIDHGAPVMVVKRMLAMMIVMILEAR